MSYMNSTLRAGREWLVALALSTATCSPSVETTSYDVGRSPRPDRVLVHDFAIHPDEVQLDSGFRGRLTQAFSMEGASDLQYGAARQVSAATTQALVEALRAGGIPAERVPGAPTAVTGRDLIVAGQVLGVDEGNQTRRRLIGFGSGMSSVEVTAQAYLAEPRRAPRLFETFAARADSGHLPGAAGTMGAGAVAGRVATSAVIGGVGQTAIGRSGDDVAEARRLGQVIAEQLHASFVRQGWAR